MDIRSVSNTASPVPISVDKKAAPSPAVHVDAPSEVSTTVPQQPVPTLSQITQAVNSINAAMTAMSADLQFSVDEDSQRTIIKIVDQETKEVLRQIPSVEALAIAKALDQAQGLLIKQKA